MTGNIYVRVVLFFKNSNEVCMTALKFKYHVTLQITTAKFVLSNRIDTDIKKEPVL